MFLFLAALIVMVFVGVAMAAGKTSSAGYRRIDPSDDDPGDLSPQEAIYAARTLDHDVYGFSGDGGFDEDDDR